MAENVVYTINLQDLLSAKLKDAEGNAVKLDNKMGNLEGTVKKVGAAVVAAFAVDKLMDFGGKVIETLAEFEKYDAVLTTTLGSGSAAKKAMGDITEFAAKTPFGVAELTGSFVKLANMGFKPTMDQMTKLGDLASSKGKSFEQLSEALIDAQTGEFERLKEFGVRASKEGDKVSFMFKGQTATVANTSDAIQAYILGLGEMQGVTGGMAAISQTTGGQISNLEDSVSALYLKIGTALKPAISGVIDALGGFVNGLMKAVEWCTQNADVVGLVASIVGGAAAAYGIYTLAVNATTIATGAITAAQWLWNAALTANPIGVVVVAIGALVAGILYAWNTFAGFRAVIMGVWGVIKEFGSVIGDVFTGVWEMISGVFTMDASKVTGGWEKATSALGNAGTRMATAYKEGYDKVMADAKADEEKMAKEKADKEAKEKAAMAPPPAGGTAGAKTKDKKDKKEGASKDVSPKGATGTKAVTINIQIGKLIESFKVQTTNLTEGSGKVREMVAQTLLSAINDSQITAGI
jgi:hypothetical protein